jgi:hypothetical protein
MRHLALAVTIITALAASSAAAFDQPKRKSGLWDMTMTNSGAEGGQTMQMCIDEKSDKLMAQQAGGMGKQSCTKNEVRKEGDKIIGESVCAFGSSTATTKAVFTGKFDSAYRVEAKTTYDPPMMGKKEGTTVIDAKWTGPCKPGQKPGDMVMPGMGTVNMNEMMKRMPKQ